MATNPMQRKARNSFLLGMLLTLLVTGAIIALLVMQLMEKAKLEQEEILAMTEVYVLNQDVASGQIITTDMLTLQKVNSNLVASNATGDIEWLTSYALKDKEGNDVKSQLDLNGKICLSIKRNGKDSVILVDDAGNFYTLKDEKNNYIYIEKDEETGELKQYIDVNGNKNKIQSEDKYIKEYVELTDVPLIAKVAMGSNTIITRELLSKSNEVLKNDVREQQYNMIVLPQELADEDYIDIRLSVPSGQDYIVVSKKRIKKQDETTIWIDMSEGEILTMNNAIVEAYIMTGSKLYATKYVEPGMQAKTTPTYPVKYEVEFLIENNPNIVGTARNELMARYNAAGQKDIRDNVLNPAIQAEDQAQQNIESKVEEEITKSQESRKNYLDELNGVTEM